MENIHKLLSTFLSHRIPWLLECPRGSALWKESCIRQIVDHPAVETVLSDRCQFGSRWKLTVRYASAKLTEDVARLNHTCRTHNKLCSRTHRAHLPLKGRAPNGASYTNLAKNKPGKLIQALAYILLDAARAHFE